MKKLIFSLFLLFYTSLYAGFFNSGTMQSKSLNLSIGGTLENNGELIGIESARISCDTFSGKGILRAPDIQLKTAVFAYTGTIDCSGKCTITTSESFNQKMFKRRGGGEFKIIIDKNLGEQVSSFMEMDYCIDDGLSMTMD